MPISKLNIEEFLELGESAPIFDVRSPSEYSHAHIPKAISFPIFTDEERKIIGTAYKQESRETAIKIGLNSFGKNMVRMVEEAEKRVKTVGNPERIVGVHCWRGGMRSAAIAWLLDLYGFEVYLLGGGYKSYRHWVLNQFEKKYPLRILSGYTGSDKTGILCELKKNKHPVIDLEGLASHKGSAFGNLEMKMQPSQEYFENLLATELDNVSKKFPAEAIWLEGESQRIGHVNIPLIFYKNMRLQTQLFLDVPFEERLAFITEHYGKYEKEKLINAIIRIKKKLGGLETKIAVNALLEDDLKTCFTVLLKYYDKLYHKSSSKGTADERKIIYIQSNTIEIKSNIEKIIQHV
ncbi:tRNA 2-selenouridine(34) synthase MnmH [Aurantibacillus circumpalustris]|uniref:tRNA 2-selenouridine(34) synthase MnmH n=1 Tax=Aurantibacillus circumpalustris TaxID=3036359 RepID=UPI00295A9AEC|nr:tRNA 2-selenouridine(34) synthase MnmH [Aurantibacillus circumpalustris]